MNILCRYCLEVLNKSSMDSYHRNETMEEYHEGEDLYEEWVMHKRKPRSDS